MIEKDTLKDSLLSTQATTITEAFARSGNFGKFERFATCTFLLLILAGELFMNNAAYFTLMPLLKTDSCSYM